MSRLALFGWIAALAAAAFPTWDIWDYELSSTAQIYGCVRTFEDSRFRASEIPSAFVSPLLGDATTLAELASQWGLPLILVGLGFHAAVKGDGGLAGRRVAGLLIVLAIAGPASPRYVSSACGGTVPVLTAEWFSIVIRAFGPLELSLLLAAVLVLFTTRATARNPAGLGVRRAAAFTVDYLVVSALVALADVLGRARLDGLDYGLLNWLDLYHMIDEPWRLLVVLAAFLYALTGRTLGKRLMGIQVVSGETWQWPGWRRAAVRALVFPVLALVPLFGLVVLAVDGLWAVADPAGRTLHDRLSGTMVIADPL